LKNAYNNALLRNKPLSDSDLSPVSATPVPLSTQETLSLLEKLLEDNQAENRITIDLAGKTTLADFMIVASGRNARHVNAMTDYALEALKNKGIKEVQIEGVPACDWVLIDAHDVIVHLFRPEVREFYNLEKMWQAARQIEA
jgi:ribosome-associated protein